MASVFCATIIFLWEKSLGSPHSDAGKLNAAPSSQIHITSRRPQSSLLAHGGVSSEPRKVSWHRSERTVFQKRRKKSQGEGNVVFR